MFIQLNLCVKSVDKVDGGQDIIIIIFCRENRNRLLCGCVAIALTC